MHPVVVFDLIFFLASLLGLIALFRGWKSAFQHSTKLLLVGLLLFTLFYGFCLALEWSGITKALDTLEDFVGALIPMWWAFVFYAFVQEMASHDLQQSEKRYRQSVENSPNPIFSVDEEGMVQTWNRACAQVFQYSSEEIIGRAYRDLLWNPEDRSVIEPLLTQVWLGHSLSGQDVVYRAMNGTQRFTISRLYPILGREGQVNGCVFANTDVTERRRAEEEIRRRALEQETLREAALALTTTLDRDEVIDRILAQLQEVVPYDTASVQLLRADPEAGREEGYLEIVGERGFPNPEEIIGLIFDPTRTDNPNREVVRTRAPFIVDNAPAVYEEFGREPHAPAGIHSWLGVPMLVGDQLVGMIALDKREPGFYTREHARLAEAFAAQAAIAMENSRLFQAEREQRELAEALEQAAAAVSATLDSDQVLDRILEQVERAVAGDAFSIVLLEDNAVRTARWRARECLGIEHRLPRLVLPADRYANLARMRRTGKALVIPDTVADPDWVRQPGWEWVRSYVGAPIQVAGSTIGFLIVDGARQGQFGPADTRRLAAFSGHAATALENAKLFEESKGHAERLAVLYEIGRDITSTLELDALLHLIVERSARLTGADKALILLVDKEGEKLTKSVGFGFAPGQIEHITYQEIQDGISGSVLRDRTPTISEDIRIDPRNTGLAMQALEAEDEPGKSIAVAPLFVKGEVIGTLTVVNNVGKPVFSQNDLDLVLMLASQAAVAIENARLYRQVRDYAGELERRVQERTAELQAQYARLDAILHSTTDGILVADAEGEILQANPVAQTWLTQILSPENVERLQEAVKDLARQVEESPEMILELTGVDLELSAAPVMEQGVGEPSAVVVDIHDISHLKALDRMRTRFVTNVSHELRTPIATIRAYAHLLREMPPGDERWGIYLDALVQETDRQVQLEEDLLQVTRIYAGRLEPESRPTSLNALADKVVADHRTLTQKRDLTLEHHPAEPGPVALVDARHVAQALSILVEDAIRYTPAGGRVIVSTGEARVEEHVWATVTVSDTGERMPAEDLPYIFERFFREEEPRSERVSKTGLRLMIVKGIVELHGGQITVESEESVGSTFTVWLPLADQQERRCSSA